MVIVVVVLFSVAVMGVDRLAVILLIVFKFVGDEER